MVAGSSRGDEARQGAGAAQRAGRSRVGNRTPERALRDRSGGGGVIDLATLPFVLFKDRYRLPDTSAVYFVVNESQILYIGKARSLLRRWRTHHRAMQMRGGYYIYWQEAPLEQ